MNSQQRDAIITRWMGHEIEKSDIIHAKHPEYGWYEIPDYSRDEYAVTLLPILEAKGLFFCLYNFGGAYQLDIGTTHADATTSVARPSATIGDAISSSVLAWIKST